MSRDASPWRRLSVRKAQRSERTSKVYAHTLGEFRQSCTKNYLDEITKQDLADYVVLMKGGNLSDRAIASRVEQMVMLLRDPDETRGKGKGIKDVTVRIKYAGKKVRSYKPHEASLLASHPPARVGDTAAVSFAPRGD